MKIFYSDKINKKKIKIHNLLIHSYSIINRMDSYSKNIKMYNFIKKRKYQPICFF